MSAFLRRGVRAGHYGADDPSVTQIVDDTDDQLLRDILSNPSISYTTPLTVRTDHTQTPT